MSYGITQPLPSQKVLLEDFSYDAITGILYWKKCKARKPGTPVRSKIRVRHLGVLQTTPRIIWKMVTGEDPLTVEHWDSDNQNNTWINLRNATRTQQLFNRTPKTRSLPLGVQKRKNRYWARLKSHGRQYRLGSFETVEEAIIARKRLEQKHQGEYAFARR